MMDSANDALATNTSNNDSQNSAAATIVEKAAPVLNSPIQSITWTKVVELCYSLPNSTSSPNADVTKRSVCFCCEKQGDSTFKLCGQCKVAKYCCRECQLQDWKKRHKRACASYQRMTYKNIPSGSTDTDNDNENKNEGTVCKKVWALRSDEIMCDVRNDFFGKIRFYVCPYSVLRYSELGRGFIFLQANHTLHNTSLLIPIDCDGYHLATRSCSVHYLTSGEYDQEVCRDDFEMTMVRQELNDAIAQYDPTKQIVVLMRFRCGHVALGTTALVPDYKLCQHLGREYYDQCTGSPIGSLQLNLDE